MLHLLFNELKASGKYAPIYISFSGAFQRFPNEFYAEAILRLIAVQFIDLPEGQRAARDRFQFNPTQVLEHKARSSNGREVVLLIDELNSLRKPLDWTGAALLREEFLDKRGRYVVFSTHSPMNVDTVIDEPLDPSLIHLTDEVISRFRCHFPRT
jgi:hypothetical protein